jgi:hypothetical protein
MWRLCRQNLGSAQKPFEHKERAEDNTVEANERAKTGNISHRDDRTHVFRYSSVNQNTGQTRPVLQPFSLLLLRPFPLIHFLIFQCDPDSVLLRCELDSQ